jgi:hypothetical protein
VNWLLLFRYLLTCLVDLLTCTGTLATRTKRHLPVNVRLWGRVRVRWWVGLVVRYEIRASRTGMSVCPGSPVYRFWHRLITEKRHRGEPGHTLTGTVPVNA